MSAYTVRPVRERDIESIIAIDALVSGQRGPDRAGFWRGLLAIQAGAAEDSVPAAPPLCHVAEVAGGSELAGFVIGDVQSWQFGLPRHGRIVAIGVHPAHRRHGVATLLAEALLGTFRKMGLPFVQCLVRPGDLLDGFFRSLGFSPPAFEILHKGLEESGSDFR